MKKLIAFALCAVMVVAALAGCSNAAKPEETTATPAADATQASQEAAKPETMTGAIDVLSREDGSGTRGAFIELFGVEQKNDAGEKVDYTTDAAEITNSTSVMLTTVAGDPAAIGYISLGALSDDVKALKIDGVEATAENVANGTYTVARPFNIATKGEATGVAADFITYVLSAEANEIIEEKGYIGVDGAKHYEAKDASGKLTISGSSSVTPLMEALKEAYEKLNPNVTIELQQSDSTTGMNDAAEGISDIGMASRELKQEELDKGLVPTVIAMDGIAVIVNNDNPLEELTGDQVRDIYTGDVTEWDAL